VPEVQAGANIRVVAFDGLVTIYPLHRLSLSRIIDPCLAFLWRKKENQHQRKTSCRNGLSVGMAAWISKNESFTMSDERTYRAGGRTREEILDGLSPGELKEK